MYVTYHFGFLLIKNDFKQIFFSSCEKGEEYNQISRMELESQSLPPTYSVQNNSNIQPMSLNPVLLEGPRYLCHII